MELENKLFWRGILGLIKFWFFSILIWLGLTAIGAGALIELLSVVLILFTAITGAIVLVSFSWTMLRTIWILLLWILFCPLPFINAEKYWDSVSALKEHLSNIWS